MQYVYGIHAVNSLIKNASQRIKKLMIDRNRHDQKIQDILQQAQGLGISFEYVDKNKLEQLVGNALHQGLLALCSPRKRLNDADLQQMLSDSQQPHFFLVLDGVQDPHNLGACMRSADAAGVEAIIIPKDNSSEISSTVEKVASGAAETIPLIKVTNLARTLRLLKEHGIWCFGLSDKANESIYQADLTGNVALVLGAEGKGVRVNVLKQCDQLYSIPMQGYVSSLNVSVATGICLFEALRQKLEICKT